MIEGIEGRLLEFLVVSGSFWFSFFFLALAQEAGLAWLCRTRSMRLGLCEHGIQPSLRLFFRSSKLEDILFMKTMYMLHVYDMYVVHMTSTSSYINLNVLKPYHTEQ